MKKGWITMGLYSKSKAERDANKLDEFADIAENYIIYEDISPEQKEKAIKTPSSSLHSSRSQASSLTRKL